jgi:hypothetical protein
MKGEIPFVASVTLLVAPMIAVCVFEVYADEVLWNIQIQNCMYVQKRIICSPAINTYLPESVFLLTSQIAMSKKTDASSAPQMIGDCQRWSTKMFDDVLRQPHCGLMEGQFCFAPERKAGLELSANSEL